MNKFLHLESVLSYLSLEIDRETGLILQGNLAGCLVNPNDIQKGDICVAVGFSYPCLITDIDIHRGKVHIVGNDNSFVNDWERISTIVPIISNEIAYKKLLENATFSSVAYDLVMETLPTQYQSMVRTQVCDYCNEEIRGARYTTSNNGRVYHSRCFNNFLSRCDRCQNIYERDEENPSERLCERCRPRNYVLPYHRYTPTLEFFGNDKHHSVPYLGVELEVDEGGETNENAAAVMKIINDNNFFVYCSHDSSLADGFEIITQPATLEYHKSMGEKYAEAFNYLIKSSYLSHDTATCGIHVHFNRNFYKDNEELYISRLLYMVDKFWEEIVKFSRRNYRRMDRFSKKIDMGIQDYIEYTNKSNDHDYHYYAVNLINDSTIEFRMFRGTLNVNTFIALLQFVNNCIITAKEKTITEIQSMEFEELITGRICKNYWKLRRERTHTED